MIVRDEARCLERCLASARPWVDGIVVLDTGSVDATVEIARRHGARVAHFAWIDDFAAARNAALAASDAALAAGARCRRMDRRRRRVARRAAPARRRHFVGQIRVASLFDAAGGGVAEAPSWLPRLLPRGVSYRGRIHEQPESALPRRRLPLVDRPRRLSRCAEGDQGRPQRAPARPGARSRSRGRLSSLSARQGPRAAARASPRPSRTIDGARALRAARRLAPRPGAAHALHAEEARPLRGGDRPGRSRDAALAGLARLLLHPRRPAARLGRGRAGARRRRCCR